MEKDRDFKYYNKTEFRHILSLISDFKYQQAIEEGYHYVEKYPYDVQAFTGLCSLLIRLGNIKEAEELLNHVTFNKKTNDISVNQYIYNKLKLLACQGKWDECYLFAKENISRLKEFRIDFYFIILYLEKKLNVSFDIPIPGYTYTMEQILHYDEQKALDHISKHVDKTESCVFCDHFPVEECYFHFRNILPLDNYPRLYSGIFHNQYVFKYDKCGTNNGKSVDYIRVITLQDSNDIITMYPNNNKANFPYIDITPKEEMNLEKVKVKRLSQIEKFNQRYGKTLDKE